MHPRTKELFDKFDQACYKYGARYSSIVEMNYQVAKRNLQKHIEFIEERAFENKEKLKQYTRIFKAED